MYVFILQKRNFVVAIRTLMQKVLEKVKKSPGKSWKVLEFFESIFLVGAMLSVYHRNKKHSLTQVVSMVYTFGKGFLAAIFNDLRDDSFQTE